MVVAFKVRGNQPCSSESVPQKARLHLRNIQFLVSDVLPDLGKHEFSAAVVVAIKPIRSGTEVYLRVAPGLRNRDVEQFLSSLLDQVTREAANDPEGTGEFENTGVL
jgi:hypothetical protein